MERMHIDDLRAIMAATMLPEVEREIHRWNYTFPGSPDPAVVTVKKVDALLHALGRI